MFSYGEEPRGGFWHQPGQSSRTNDDFAGEHNGASKSNAGSILQAKVFVGETHHFEDDSGTFSPTSSTLIMGETDAVLVDAQHIRSDVHALSDMIAQTGKRLTTIYVTHDHADHWYGIGQLVRRFPSARAVTTAGRNSSAA